MHSVRKIAEDSSFSRQREKVRMRANAHNAKKAAIGRFFDANSTA